MKHFKIKSLGPVSEADIRIGDLTLFVGPQATGKSIVLQTLKLIIDRHNIPDVLSKNNYEWGKKIETLLDLYFGESMSAIWTGATKVELDGKEYPKNVFLPKQPTVTLSRSQQVFYIPAQRVITMSQGWPRAFGAFDIGDPYVLKQFSESIRSMMEKETVNGGKDKNNIFPKSNRIKEPLRKLLDDSIFHGSTIESDNNSLRKRFLLKVGDTKLPFMTWSAGQKEFMPLLLSLYYLMPSSKLSCRDDIKTVIIEEPEMGLHPKAILALMVIFLELIARGYKLIISTHSPALPELLWAIKNIRELGGSSAEMFELFDMPKSQSIKGVFETAIREKTFSTFYFEPSAEGVVVKDISTLDSGAEDKAISDWGGLTDFASRASEVISGLVKE